MKVLLIGDASNYHAALAQGLAALGHQVTVASHGSRWMDTHRDIDLSRRPGKLGGLVLWVRLNALLARDLRGYDIVHISNPIFVEQRPKRVKWVFDQLKRHNGKIYLTMLGTDSNYVDLCLHSDVLRYSEWAIDGQLSPMALANLDFMRQWLSPMLADHCQYVYDNVDGVVTALYEYQKVCQRFVDPDRLAYGGIPIVTDAATPLDPALPMRIMVAAHKGREDEKGIDRMLPIIQDLCAAHPQSLQLDLVQDLPFDQFRQRLGLSHIVVDQLYSYTPATTALMAMAQGKVVVSGGEPEYYDFIDEPHLRPIINADPYHLDNLQADIMRLVTDPQLLRQASAQGIEFVRKHNDAQVVARRFVDFWQRF